MLIVRRAGSGPLADVFQRAAPISPPNEPFSIAFGPGRIDGAFDLTTQEDADALINAIKCDETLPQDERGRPGASFFWWYRRVHLCLVPQEVLDKELNCQASQTVHGVRSKSFIMEYLGVEIVTLFAHRAVFPYRRDRERSHHR